VNSFVEWSRSLPRWLAFPALLLLLSFVFASQLFWSGYVTPWSRAFVSELVYWSSWGILGPLIFWMCQRLKSQTRGRYALGVLLGAIVAAVLQPQIAQLIAAAQASLHSCIGSCDEGAGPLAGPWFARTMRLAGINLPVYASFVLAWQAATYSREARDRQLKSMELESLLHQAQLQALRNQLNPHFLFNVLHSIAELVHGNPKLAEQLIVRLGELLRQVLQSSTLQEVPLAEELALVRGYVEIEQMRLGERLQVRWEIEPATLQARVPSLILQPLVENAIQHGIAATAQHGMLTIRASRDGDFLRLQVHDTGPGIAQSVSARSAGIGLSNTRTRLERLYGDRQSLDLSADGGLLVSVRVPVGVS
jgi:two-component system, LytTR family, sensor kinase